MEWRDLSQQALEAQYNPRIAAPDFEQHFVAYRQRSEAARAALLGYYDIRYGDGPLQTYDAYPAPQPGAPIFVIVHGGYWRGLDKSLHSFLAPAYHAAGCAVVNINYDLAPKVTLDTIVAQTQAALAHIAAHAARYNGDAGRMVVFGHSAGAHLAAAAYALPWPAQLGPRPQVAGLALVSGIYDLEPVLHIGVNQEIGLDGATAQRNSLLHQAPRLPGCQTLIAVGGAEPQAWRDQSDDFHRACRDAGNQAHLMQIAGAHHFSVLYAVEDVKQPLGGAILALLKG